MLYASSSRLVSILRRFVRLLVVRPRLDYWYVSRLYENTSAFSPLKIASDELHGLVSRLTSLAYPYREDEFDKWWIFYLPLKRKKSFFSELIAVPLWILRYRDRYFIELQSIGHIAIYREDDPEVEGLSKLSVFVREGVHVDVARKIILEAYRFSMILMKNPNLIEELVPYDIRTGKIKGKYVLENTFPRELGEFVLRKYKEHLSKNLTMNSVSLNEYLSVAAICYKAVFGERVKGMKPVEMYMRWADMRHGGMLDIKDWDSREEFKEWLTRKRDPGAHPFEIIASFFEKGIVLYPPTKMKPKFILACHTYLYASAYVAIVMKLIEHEIPFEAPNLEKMIEYLTGEMYFTVNYGHPLTSIRFYGDKEDYKKYFRHIIWDKLEIPKWRIQLKHPQ